jgi:hypothetical protein
MFPHVSELVHRFGHQKVGRRRTAKSGLQQVIDQLSTTVFQANPQSITKLSLDFQQIIAGKNVELSVGWLSTASYLAWR